MPFFLVRFKNQSPGRCPVELMQFHSDKFPGQYFLSNDKGDFIIFSGIGLPNNKSEIIPSLKENEKSIRTPGYDDVSEINEIPENAVSLHSFSYNRAMDKFSSASLTPTLQQLINKIAKRRTRLVELLKKDIKENIHPLYSQYIILLERLTKDFFFLSNNFNVANHASSYISHVLLKYTSPMDSIKTIEEKQITSDDMLCSPTFNFKRKQDKFTSDAKNVSNINKVTEAGTKLFVKELCKDKKIQAEVKFDEKFNELKITLQDYNTNNHQIIFVEEARVALFVSALDAHFIMTDVSFSYKPKNLISVSEKKDDGYLTDEGEESFLEKNTKAVIVHNKFDELKYLKWEKMKFGNDYLHGVRSFYTKNALMFKPLMGLGNALNKMGLAASVEEHEESGVKIDSLLKITLRKKKP